jgi:hypothetical protein
MTPHVGSARVAETHCPLTNFFCARLSLHKKCVLGPSGPRVNSAAVREIGASILYDKVSRDALADQFAGAPANRAGSQSLEIRLD